MSRQQLIMCLRVVEGVKRNPTRIHETLNHIIFVGLHSGNGLAGRSDVQDCSRVHLFSFESLPGQFYAAGGLSKSIQLQSAGQLSALPPGCLRKVLMHLEAECCSAATHTGHFFRLLTASFKRSKLFLCRKKKKRLFQSCSFKVKLQMSDLVWS